MSEERDNVGYEIMVKTPKECQVYCVDGSGKIRGHYLNGCRNYFSDSELWSDAEGMGIMKGGFKKGDLVSIVDLEGRLLEINGFKIENLPIVRVDQVNIDKMLSDPYIAGIDRP